MPPFPIGNAGWRSFMELPNKNFDCGFCGKGVSSIKGYCMIGQSRDGSGSRCNAGCIGITSFSSLSFWFVFSCTSWIVWVAKS